MKRAIIIDDELIGVNGLQFMLEKHCPDLKVVATSTDAEEGIKLIENYRPDVVFLDITMPKMDGFELLDKVEFRDFKLVFTTAHQEYAVRAIKTQAYDYLLKPIDVGELKNCVAQLHVLSDKQSSHERANRVIELAVKDGVIFIKPQSLVRLEASGSYTVFYLDNNVRHMASKNLKECEQMLDGSTFFRCHPSHIVNLSKVSKLVSSNGLFALMSDGSKADVSKKNKDLLIDKLKTV